MPIPRLLSLLICIAASLPSLLVAADRPNLLVILTDDQGWGDLSLHDGPGLTTPHLDSIAKDGARFDRFYVSPVCAPTRASFLTGRYHWRTGVHGVTRGRERMRSGETTIAEVLRDAGYDTAAFGKWHNGGQYPLDPVGQGFDTFYGFCAGHWNNYFDTTLRMSERQPDGNVVTKDVSTDGFLVDLLADAAIDFVTEKREQPFFCYLPINTPHTPSQMPDKYWDRFASREDIDVKAKSAYALIENIDDNVGRVLAALEESGQAENTIVVFFTDNGANSNRWDGDMRGAKGSIHEGGIRVPCFVRWPGHVEAGRVIDTVGMHCDLLPTLTEMCDVPFAGDNLDGVSLAGAIAPGEFDRVLADSRILITTHGPRTGPIESAKRSLFDTGTKLRATYERDWQLWDIAADPSQRTPITDQRPEELAKLKAVWSNYVSEIGELEIVPAPVGAPDADSTRLPGHEAILVGSDGTLGREAAGRGISYHGENGWANDYLDHWTETTASAYWPVDVLTDGAYRVSVEYRLHPINAGVAIRVEAGEAFAATTLDEAYDSAPIASPDRFRRGETYDYNWLTRAVGTLQLHKGEQKIELKLTNITGSEGPKVIGLRLQRVGQK